MPLGNEFYPCVRWKNRSCIKFLSSLCTPIIAVTSPSVLCQESNLKKTGRKKRFLIDATALFSPPSGLKSALGSRTLQFKCEHHQNWGPRGYKFPEHTLFNYRSFTVYFATWQKKVLSQFFSPLFQAMIIHVFSQINLRISL